MIRHGVAYTLMALLVSACSNGTEPAPPADSGPDAPVQHRVATVVEGLVHPWGLAFLPGTEGILVTERPGRLRLVRNGTLQAEPIAGVPQVWAQGQGGLLDVAVHPQFASNRLVYLSYSKQGPRGATTAVARGRLEDGRLTGVQDIFVAEAWSSGGQHFGSRMVFGRDGMLYVTVGERGLQAPAQSLANHVGSTVRLHDDGRVPANNAFAGQAGALPEIHAYGQRNVQAMAVDPGTGEIWQAEHGPSGGDALNILRAGANYGWPDYSFGNHYDGRPIANPPAGSGITVPVTHWSPAIAPSGMTIYNGSAFPQWRGDIFIGSLTGQHLRRVRMDGGRVVEQEALLQERRQRIRAVATGPDGLIYLLVDASSAPMLRLEPARQ
jgi:aldose sugar dehydrogenase